MDDDVKGYEGSKVDNADVFTPLSGKSKMLQPISKQTNKKSVTSDLFL